MDEPLPEKEHIIKLLKESRKALRSNNALKLKHLSDQTIHSASVYQHTDYIIIAILVYAMSKLVFRRNYLNIRHWDRFATSFGEALRRAAKALEKNNHPQFIKELENAREALGQVSDDLQPYIQNVLEKASINKASKVYEHGISLGQTATLLGVSLWDLTEYIGERGSAGTRYDISMSIKKRAKMALDFFGGEQ